MLVLVPAKAVTADIMTAMDTEDTAAAMDHTTTQDTVTRTMVSINCAFA